MLIDLNEVLKNDGKVMKTDVGLGFSVFTSKLGEFPIISRNLVSLKLQNKGERKLLIAGNTQIVVKIPCDRCLEEVEVSIPLVFEKEVDMKEDESDRIQSLNDQVYIEGYNLDVDKLVYSELLVNWPSKVLCKEDCKGLCSICGTNLNQKTCGCRNEDLDPRMAKIQEIFNKFKEV